MATWVTHIAVADGVLTLGLELEKRGFYVGNIAPDCNIENEDWTAFTPPREITHWMNGSSKLTADYEGFYDKYIRNKVFNSCEECAFMYGYYAHLITDVEFQKFVRNEKRVADCFRRIKENQIMKEKIAGYSEDFDTLKKVFGKQRVFNDIAVLETSYLKENPYSGYLNVLLKVKEFPDYLDYFPRGAFLRKIEIMGYIPDESCPKEGLIFFSQNEYNVFVETTVKLVYQKIKEKLQKAD